MSSLAHVIYTLGGAAIAWGAINNGLGDRSGHVWIWQAVAGIWWLDSLVTAWRANRD